MMTKMQPIDNFHRYRRFERVPDPIYDIPMRSLKSDPGAQRGEKQPRRRFPVAPKKL